MQRLNRPRRRVKVLSRRAIGELGELEASLQQLGTDRSAALQLLLASRNTTTALTQREFWLEFSWIDEEYRAAVRDLAEFCAEHAER